MENKLSKKSYASKWAAEVAKGATCSDQDTRAIEIATRKKSYFDSFIKRTIRDVF